MQASIEIQAKQCFYLGGTIVNMLAFLWEIYKGFVYTSVFMINFWILEFLIAHRNSWKMQSHQKAQHSSWKSLAIDSSDYKGTHHYHAPMVPLQRCRHHGESKPVCCSAPLSLLPFLSPLLPSFLSFHSFFYQLFIANPVPGAVLSPREYSCEQDRSNPCPYVAYILQSKFSTEESHMLKETCDLSWKLAWHYFLPLPSYL